MGNKKKKRSQGRKKTQKGKGANGKKTPAPTPLPAREKHVVEEVHKEVVENGKREVENGVVERRWRVCGLANVRNTCYFNSVLQLLLSSSCLRDFFSEIEMRMISPCASLTAALCELFDTAQSTEEKRNPFKPSKALGAIRTAEPAFKSREQHDAHELLIALLHHLVEEAETVGGRTNGIPSNWMDVRFGGKLTSRITCINCGYTKSRDEGFLVLSISVMKDEDVIVPESLKAYPLTLSAELPDIVERSDPEALQHLQPQSDVSSTRNNFLDDSSSEARQTEGESVEGEDTCLASQDLSGVDDESEAEELPSVLHMSDSSASLYEEASPETANNELSPTPHGKGNRKNKQKGKKGKNRLKAFDVDVEEWKASSASQRIQSVDACLRHFFSHERVTWRCAGESPEKKVTFAKGEPEVFLLPPMRESRYGNWKSYFDDEDLLTEGQSDEEEDEASDSPDAEIPILPGIVSGLKSCLKKQDRDQPPPTPSLNSEKQYLIRRAPKVLCIHLKRFQASSHKRITKLDHAVHFDMKINLKDFMDPNSTWTGDTEYQLKGVVCHAGSLGFGHYTAFASRPAGDGLQWYDVSDSDVRKASISDVLKSQAYILLYEAQPRSGASPVAS